MTFHHVPTDGPAVDAVAVTPNDTTDLGEFRGLYIGTTGDVAVVTLRGSTVTFKNVPVGELAVAGTKVMATNTTATDILALY